MASPEKDGGDRRGNPRALGDGATIPVPLDPTRAFLGIPQQIWDRLCDFPDCKVREHAAGRSGLNRGFPGIPAKGRGRKALSGRGGRIRVASPGIPRETPGDGPGGGVGGRRKAPARPPRPPQEAREADMRGEGIEKAKGPRLGMPLQGSVSDAGIGRPRPVLRPGAKAALSRQFPVHGPGTPRPPAPPLSRLASPGSGWRSCGSRAIFGPARAAFFRSGSGRSAAAPSAAPHSFRPLRIPFCPWDKSCRQKPCRKASAGEREALAGCHREDSMASGDGSRALIEHSRSGKIRAGSCASGCVLLPMQQAGLSSSGDDADGLPAIPIWGSPQDLQNTSRACPACGRAVDRLRGHILAYPCGARMGRHEAVEFLGGLAPWGRGRRTIPAAVSLASG